ncbi:TerC family protein [Azospira inquinata]|uniref:TerC family protein n=1 Tax=Azospira inquinata TaxID=2785627 RepID=A0A975XU98_9RHOO|nr:TerC family protein [Azospira inquinata]QWT46114.1 TerC family protein [Azospira inquinata]QWT48557.1 TerC family protein [Azospira inquinata]
MNSIGTPGLWAGFSLFVLLATVMDLVGLQRHGNRAVTARQALLWSLLWVSLALGFCGLLWGWLDHEQGRALANRKALEFLTGYVIEKSLSVDNIFVFLMLFTSFAVPGEQQKKALVAGVVGAILLRLVMILVGAWVISRFHWVLYLFGAFLLYTGAHMVWAKEEREPDPEHHPLVRWMRRHLPILPQYQGDSLAVMRDGKRWFTPLFLVVVLIGISDAMFAVDSIPAVFAVTTDPFIVASSNIFAILGLRALYFLLASMATRFRLLKYGLAGVLMFVGVKMLVAGWWTVPTLLSLGVIAALLSLSILASWRLPAAPKGAGPGALS